MTLSLTAHQTRLLRLKAQRLHPTTAASLGSPEQVLRAVVAVQSQDLPAARLSIRARSTGLTAASVEQARQDERSIIWTWCMRGTLHLVRGVDAGWLIPLFGPQFIAAGMRRFRQLGWDEKRADAGLKLLRHALAEHGELTRPEIASLLEENHLPYQGQATIHLIGRAALHGIICMGADRGGKTTYVLYERWVGKLHPLDSRDALAEIAVRYLEAYGPAGPQDLASWSGLKLADAREAWQLIADRLVEVQADGRQAWMLGEQLPWLDELPEEGFLKSGGSTPVVRLLPAFDTYLLGYHNRGLAVEAEYARRIHPGGGLIYPALLVDGRALGTWKSSRRGDHLEVVVTPFESLADELLPSIEAEAADVARFLDSELHLTIAASTRV